MICEMMEMKWFGQCSVPCVPAYKNNRTTSHPVKPLESAAEDVDKCRLIQVSAVYEIMPTLFQTKLHFATNISATVTPTLISPSLPEKGICGIRTKSVWLVPHAILWYAPFQESVDSCRPFFIVIPSSVDHF